MKNSKASIVMLVCLLLCGCGKVDAVAQKVMNDIDSIAEVELSDKELIEKLEQTYSTLTDKQKEQIDNYAVLLNARDELDILIKEEEEKRIAEEKAKEEEEKKKEEEERQAKLSSYTHEVKFCAKSILSVKELLKNPSSMQVNEFCYADMDNTEFVYIDVSAENGFGGSSRSCYMVTNDENYGIYGTLNSHTFMYCIDGEPIGVNSELVDTLSTYDGVDHEAVYQLLEEYESTKDESLLK